MLFAPPGAHVFYVRIFLRQVVAGKVRNSLPTSRVRENTLEAARSLEPYEEKNEKNYMETRP